jgi:hypothetical protein
MRRLAKKIGKNTTEYEKYLLLSSLFMLIYDILGWWRAKKRRKAEVTIDEWWRFRNNDYDEKKGN